MAVATQRARGPGMLERSLPRSVQRSADGPDPVAAGPVGHCACGGGCPRCEAGPALMPKLDVSSPGDPLELEADRIADAVVRGQAAAFSTPAGEGEGQIQRCGDVHGDACPCHEAPPVVGQVLRSAGEPLDEGTRSAMESGFGRDFGGVRVHADSSAAESARAVNALAYTVGNSIVFASGHYQPGTAGGQRLIAHELAHVVQQSDGAYAIQRFVPCTRARLNLEECPKREPGEVAQSRTSPMEIGYIDWPEEGFIVANFAVGQDALKAGAKLHASWTSMVQTISQPNTQWSITGLADCHGDDSMNDTLRKNRADAVFGALPLAARGQIVNSAGANKFQCLTENENAYDRSINRAALIRLEKTELTFPADKIEGKRPVPKPVPRPSADCTDQEQKELAAAQPIAVAMVEKAMSVLGNRTPEVRDLLSKYFNDPAGNYRIFAGFKATLAGLKTTTKFECEHKGEVMYSHFCKENDDFVTWAYVRPLVGFRVHLCEAAFGKSDLKLARIIVHEHSHMYDQTDDERYCSTGRCGQLDRWDAYDNADSYAWFAHDAFINL